MTGTLKFKIATEPWEFNQINKLNYETFVEEIGQHNPNSDRKLLDKFHNENDYIVCINNHDLLGMLAVCSSRPFSLDRKLDDLDSYLPAHRSVCEVRLLVVKKGHRYTHLLGGLVRETVKYCLNHGYDLAVISGILEQQKLYKHMGFVPFGPVVGIAKVRFQPMYLVPKAYARSKISLSQPVAEIVPAKKTILMPGPVEINSDVYRAFGRRVVSHRSEEFLEIHKDTKRLLSKLVNSKHVEIFMGSGTLANDVIAGQLSLNSGRGLVLTNGEFGERLIDCAVRFGLKFETLTLDWGESFDDADIKKILTDNSDIKWLWAVHCETSTGMLNDMAMLKDICSKRGILLCLDCVSSIGNTHVDLKDIYLASAVSGKGLCSLSGLSMVFYSDEVVSSSRSLPRYLDLGVYAEKDGVPFTVCSNLVYALHTALKQMDITERLKQICELSMWLRRELCKHGLDTLVSAEHGCPAVITIRVPDGLSSENIGRKMANDGYLLSYRSEYLLKRNWIQICLMGETSQINKRLGLLLMNLEQLFCQHTKMNNGNSGVSTKY